MNEFFHFPEMKNLLWGKKKKNFKTRFPFCQVSTFWREKIKGCKYISSPSFFGNEKIYLQPLIFVLQKVDT